jgi:transposase
MGYLLAQQLVAAGERVLDVQPKLGARVRLLAAGDTNKNDPNDARSVAVAALRSPGVRQVAPDDHPAVLKVWSKRYRDLGRTRTQVVCRLHAVLCELIPGGVSKAITAPAAARLLDSIEPATAVDAARCELAADFLDDLQRIGAQLRETRKKLTTAVQASGTSLTGLFGVGPVIAAAVIGDVKDVSRFPSRDHFAACDGTAPIEVSSGQRTVYRLSRRGNRRLNHAIHMAAVTQVRHQARHRFLRTADLPLGRKTLAGYQEQSPSLSSPPALMRSTGSFQPDCEVIASMEDQSPWMPGASPRREVAVPRHLHAVERRKGQRR